MQKTILTARYASPQKAEQKLGWKAEKTIAQACADSWKWQSQNHNGYETVGKV